MSGSPRVAFRGRRETRGGVAPSNAGATAAWFDIQSIKAAVRISDVLAALGHDLGRHGRSVCPLHQGESRTAFKYDDSRFHCFRCGVGGDAFVLAQRLLGGTFGDAARFCAEIVGVHADRRSRHRVRQEKQRREAAAARRAADFRSESARWHALVREYEDAACDCTMIENLWARDPYTTDPIILRALDDLSRLYIRRDLLEARIFGEMD